MAPCCRASGEPAPGAPAGVCRPPRRAGARARASGGSQTQSAEPQRAQNFRSPGLGGGAALVVHDARMICADVLSRPRPSAWQASARRHREPAPAGGLAADRAVAEHERIWVRRLDAEPHRAAVAGSLLVPFTVPHSWCCLVNPAPRLTRSVASIFTMGMLPNRIWTTMKHVPADSYRRAFVAYLRSGAPIRRAR